MRRKIRKLGGSLIVTIPMDIVKDMQLKENDYFFFLKNEDGELTVKKVRKIFYKKRNGGEKQNGDS